MLSTALKKSLSSVYEPTSYKRLYKLLMTLFAKDSTLDDLDTGFELELTANLDQAGIVLDIH